jgi:hypothetical protein
MTFMRGFRGLGARRSTLGTSVGCWMYVVRICRKTGHLACQRQLNLCCSSSTSADRCGRYVDFFLLYFRYTRCARSSYYRATPILRCTLLYVWSGICVRMSSLLSLPFLSSRPISRLKPARQSTRFSNTAIYIIQNSSTVGLFSL